MVRRLSMVFGLFFSLTSCLGSTLDAAWSVHPGKAVPIEDVATLTPREHYSRACQFYSEGRWDRSAKEFRLAALHFPETSYGQDANFFLALSYYHMSELELANEAFDRYLQCQTNPMYFTEAIEYKFAIAERFRVGEKRRCLGSKQMPKWASGSNLAIDIYDRVVPAMPNHEIATRALYGKGCLLRQQRDYRESIDTFQTLINRFPKSELTPESFLQIADIYLEQCQREFQNPDLLALAEINLQKFEQQFPGEERLENARENYRHIKEVYAQGMFETANFYERVDQPRAAMMYYQKAILDFPETAVAYQCRLRLRTFCPAALKELETVEAFDSDADEMNVPDNIEITDIEEYIPA